MTSPAQDLPPLPEWSPSVEPKDLLLPRHWLRQVREHRGLTQKALVQRMAQQDPPCWLALASYGRLETGRRSVSELPLPQQIGLRQALEIPVEVWKQVFGEKQR